MKGKLDTDYLRYNHNKSCWCLSQLKNSFPTAVLDEKLLGESEKRRTVLYSLIQNGTKFWFMLYVPSNVTLNILGAITRCQEMYQVLSSLPNQPLHDTGQAGH